MNVMNNIKRRLYESKYSSLVKDLAGLVDEKLLIDYGVFTEDGGRLDLTNAINPFFVFWDNGYKTIGYAEYGDGLLDIYIDIDNNNTPVKTIKLNGLSGRLNKTADNIVNIVARTYGLKPKPLESRYPGLVKKLADKVDEKLFNKYGIVTEEEWMEILNAIKPFYRFWDRGDKTIGYAEYTDYDDDMLYIYVDIDTSNTPVMSVKLNTLSRNLSKTADRIVNVVARTYGLN